MNEIIITPIYLANEFVRFSEEKRGKFYFKNVDISQLYEDNKQYFSTLANIINKTKINYESYLSYIFNSLPPNYTIWPKYLINKTVIKKYSNALNASTKYKTLITFYENTCKTIATDCSTYAFTPQEYISYLVNENVIGNYIISGKISKYWLVLLGKKLIIKIKNSLADAEALTAFDKLLKYFDVYLYQINDSYIKTYGVKPNPIENINKFLIHAM